MDDGLRCLTLGRQHVESVGPLYPYCATYNRIIDGYWATADANPTQCSPWSWKVRLRRGGLWCEEGSPERRVPRGAILPSVRELAKELKIHRNTAHQIVKYLAENGWLKTCPRALTEITKVGGAPAGERLTHRVDQLVVEARRLGWDLAELVHAVEERGRSRSGLKCRRDRSTRLDASLPGVAGPQVFPDGTPSA
jgi:DNA-binding transcriptional regulator YhcF (GntR family)